MSVRMSQNDDMPNPLDKVEETLSSNNWTFNRMTDKELVVQVSGTGCTYDLFFIWQEDMNALQFCCQYDLNIPNHMMDRAAKALMNINANIWMGHFDIPFDTGIPSFRQTCLFRGQKKPVPNEHIEDLVDIALVQCERYHAVFTILASGAEMNDQVLSLAMMQTEGES